MRESFCKLKQLFACCFFVIPYISLFANAPDILESKKLSVSFNIPAKNAIGVHEFYILDAVNLAGYYWKTSNDSSDNPNWSKERYNYRQTGNSTGNLTVINSSGEPTLLELSFSSSTTASCNLSFWSMTGGQLVKESHTGTATVSLSDLILSDIPSGYQVSEPSGYYAPASIAGGTLSAQDQYWSIYDESVSFSSTGTFTANITNGTDDPSGSGSYTYSKTGTNTASLSYTVDDPGYSFEYDLQFTGENAGIYSKYADYDGSTDVTTGPFSLSGVAVPEQYVWEDYDDFSGSSLDTNNWEVGYFAGGETVTVVNGQAQLSGSAYSPSSPSQMPSDFANAGQDATEGNTFLFIKDPSIIGLEADIMIPNTGNQNEAGVYLTTLDSNPFGSLGFELRKTATGSSFNYSYFDDQGSKIYGYEAGSLDTFYKIKITELNSQISYYLDNKLIKQVATTSHDTDYWGIGAFNDNGMAYTTYADNVRVLRQGTATIEPDPVTVVSDPNGQAVVVQVGEEYKWNDTLDGLSLWGVWQDDDNTEWVIATVSYVNGRKKGAKGSFATLPASLDVDHPYVVNEDIIDVTETNGHQYYQVTSFENGIIYALDGDGAPLTDPSWWFTTRAAAEEFYYSRANPKDWMWFDQYPWVYSNEQQDWLYFHPSGGTLMYWSNKGQAWRQFN
jgi:hypothetical protein